MCCYADPVSMSPVVLRRDSFAVLWHRRGVHYICMVQRRASQLTHSINGEGEKMETLGGRREEKHIRCSTQRRGWLSVSHVLFAPSFLGKLAAAAPQRSSLEASKPFQ